MSQQQFVKVKASFDQAYSSFDLPARLTWADLSVIVGTIAAQIGEPLQDLQITHSKNVSPIQA